MFTLTFAPTLYVFIKMKWHPGSCESIAAVIHWLLLKQTKELCSSECICKWVNIPAVFSCRLCDKTLMKACKCCPMHSWPVQHVMCHDPISPPLSPIYCTFLLLSATTNKQKPQNKSFLKSLVSLAENCFLWKSYTIHIRSRMKNLSTVLLENIKVTLHNLPTQITVFITSVSTGSYFKYITLFKSKNGWYGAQDSRVHFEARW